MKELWSQEEAAYHGTFYDFPPVRSFPKPVQQPHPPVLLGGAARNVLKRTVAWGDGWLPIGSSPEDIKKGRHILDELAAAAGRDPRSIDVTVLGVPSDSAAIQHLVASGASRVVTRLSSTVSEEALTELEQIAARVFA